MFYMNAMFGNYFSNLTNGNYNFNSGGSFGSLTLFRGGRSQMPSSLGGYLNSPIGYQPPVYQPPVYQPPVYQPPVYQPPVYQPPAPQPPVYQPPVYQPPVYQPPVYTPPPTPPVYKPPVYQPPVYTPPPAPTQVRGSAGLFGDPRFGVFTPNLNVPNALKDFQSNIGAGQTVTLLNDPDRGGFQVSGTGIQVNPADPNSVGIGQFVINSGSSQAVVHNNGNIVIGGDMVTSFDLLKQNGPMTLGSGTLSVSNQIDGPNGQMADRLVFQNGEYKLTAALRSPHPDAQNYFDMNFEELLSNAANNATGYRTTVPDLTQSFGIADLLRLEPGGIIA